VQIEQRSEVTNEKYPVDSRIIHCKRNAIAVAAIVKAWRIKE